MRYIFLVVFALVFISCADRVQNNDIKDNSIKDIQKPSVEDKDLLPPQVPKL